MPNTDTKVSSVQIFLAQPIKFQDTTEKLEEVYFSFTDSLRVEMLFQRHSSFVEFKEFVEYVGLKKARLFSLMLLTVNIWEHVIPEDAWDDFYSKVYEEMSKVDHLFVDEEFDPRSIGSNFDSDLYSEKYGVNLKGEDTIPELYLHMDACGGHYWTFNDIPFATLYEAVGDQYLRSSLIPSVLQRQLHAYTIQAENHEEVEPTVSRGEMLQALNIVLDDERNNDLLQKNLPQDTVYVFTRTTTRGMKQ